jgi:hypothetical protein
MTFEEAVVATPHLGLAAYHPGLQALKATDRARIDCANTAKLSGSVDVDAAIQPSQQDAHRWDYAIGYRRKTEAIYWVEVHPASLGDVARVRDKFLWLRAWLAGDGNRLEAFDAEFVWISSGKTTFTQASPAIRKLAQEGVRTVGRSLKIA